ncbi:beta-glucosidase 6-like isoform X2 [Tasmannia lanceolata]|uniref:beta-glucosidase 6-like isoform X2 n=1 Tax=Tasmannia lanceolata TaxID=3420 RepID=UPI004064589C
MIPKRSSLPRLNPSSPFRNHSEFIDDEYEGAAKSDGRGRSIWDTYAFNSGQVVDGSTGEVAVDQYHLYKGDINLITDMLMDAYRFSISWSRIFPHGSGAVNQLGVDYYNNLIDTLITNELVPFVTLYHWDLPQALEDSYGGWLSPRIIYDLGGGAPGRCSLHIPGRVCKSGNSSTEPYIAMHHVLLSHAAAYRVYQAKFKGEQGGTIGMSLDMAWYEPMSNSTQDIKTAQVAQDFQLGWILDPIYFGDYPLSMKERVKERLPEFSKTQTDALKGSLDFVGINHYTTYYAMDISNISAIKQLLNNDTFVDAGAFPNPFRNGEPIGDMGASIWLYVVPWGMRKAMNYVKNRYGNPTVIVTENGIDEVNDPNKTLIEALDDQKRIDYHRDYLSNLSAAINEDGCNVTGYFAWSLLDNWEWTSGFSVRFGLYFVDYNSPGLTRYAKSSVRWFTELLFQR